MAGDDSALATVPAAGRAETEQQVVARLRRTAATTSATDGQRALREAETLLRTSASSRVRNAAALAIADMRHPDAPAILNEVAAQPQVAQTAGTLLYALSELEGPVALSTVLNVVRSGSYEARAELMIAIETGGVIAWAAQDGQDAKRELERLAGSDDSDAADAADLSLQLLGLNA